MNLVLLILDGASGLDNLSRNLKFIAVHLAQLLRYKAVETKLNLNGLVRHSNTNEPHLPVGLMVHSSIKKNSLVEKQWMQPERFNKYEIIMGTLHLEMAFPATIGDWLESNH